MKKILVICGPTATGKTDLGIKLAKEFNGEIISVDSRQVYKGLDIGTGKLPNNLDRVEKGSSCWTIDNIPIWMYDVADPSLRFSVADYLEKATPIIQDILNREKLPILVGGTGLYLQGLLSGFDLLKTPTRNRKELEKLNLESLQKKLGVLSPAVFKSLNNSEKNNPRRLMRKIELLEGESQGKKSLSHSPLASDFDILKIGLTAPRSFLNGLIDIRVNKRIDQGMIDEARNLHNNDLSIDRMKELGLEYGLLADLLYGKISTEQFIDLLKTKIHQYAKRQITWFKRDETIRWFDITAKNWEKEVDKLASDWYN